MLLTLLFTNTAYFALTVFSAFVFLAGGLLFLDSWKVNRANRLPLWRGLGFLLLAAASLQISFLPMIKLFGLGLILISLVLEPIIHPPKKTRAALILPLTLPLLTWSLRPVTAMLYLLISTTYLRKSTEGKERQLRPAWIAFLFLGLAETISIHGYFAETAVIFWSKLLAQFGPVWSLQHLLQLIGVLILAAWIWGYARFRLQLQLFVLTIALTLAIFLSTTVLFTFLLLKNIEADALTHLKTDAALMQYALQSLQERTLAQAQTVAQDSEIKAAFTDQNQAKLYPLAIDFLAAQQTSTLLLASTSGTIVVRAEDNEQSNDNISTDPIFAPAVEGAEVATVTYEEGVLQPVISVRAAVPIREGNRSSGKIIGVVVTGLTVDSAFVDGVKAVTGLDTTVFGREKRAATTFVAPDGKSRYVGTLETNPNVLEKVLGDGEPYVGAANVLNQPFYAAYSPLKSIEGRVVGMLFVGQPQTTLIDAAKRSIDLTFLGSAVLMAVSLIPTYFFSRFLREHLEA